MFDDAQVLVIGGGYGGVSRHFSVEQIDICEIDFFKSLSHQKESYYFGVLNKICL